MAHPVRTITLLRSATDEECAELVGVMMDAFPEDDPTKIGLLGGRLELKQAYFTAVLRATLLEGEVWVVDAGGRRVTVGLWFKWPRILFASEAQKALGYNALFEQLPAETRRWWDTGYGEQVDVWLQRKTISDEEWNRMWYCSMLATRAAEQNKGHATALVDHVLAKVHGENGGMVGLGTGGTLNVAKYESMGFTERGHVTVRTAVNSFHGAWLTKDVDKPAPAASKKQARKHT